MDQPNDEQAICLLATEWWKATQRLMRLCRDELPAREARERAMAEYAFRRVGETLGAMGIRMIDHTGREYSAGLVAEPVNPEDFDSEHALVVTETIEPTLARDGRILRRGKVTLGHARAGDEEQK